MVIELVLLRYYLRLFCGSAIRSNAVQCNERLGNERITMYIQTFTEPHLILLSCINS